MNAGWGWPGNAKKAHYFEKGEMISLCGRWMYSGHREPDDVPMVSTDDCAVCTRKRAKAKKS